MGPRALPCGLGVFVRAVLALLRRRARQAGVSSGRGGAVAIIDAVEHERMDVNVQIQGGAEALNVHFGSSNASAVVLRR